MSIAGKSEYILIYILNQINKNKNLPIKKQTNDKY